MSCPRDCNCPNCNEELARVMRMSPAEYSDWLTRTQRQVKRLVRAGGQPSVMRHAEREDCAPDARATTEAFLSASPRERTASARERAERAAARAERERVARLRPADAAGATVPAPPSMSKYLAAKARGLSSAEAMSEARS